MIDLVVVMSQLSAMYRGRHAESCFGHRAMQRQVSCLINAKMGCKTEMQNESNDACGHTYVQCGKH